MKTCPTCRRTFAADGPNFCPDDGTPLTGYNAPPPNAMPYGGTPPPPPQYAPRGYAPPGYAPPAGKRKGLAFAALVVGLVTLFLTAAVRLTGLSGHVVTLTLSTLLALAAIVLGAVALVRSLRRPQAYGGKVPASLGALFGVLAIGLSATLFAVDAISRVGRTRYADSPNININVGGGGATSSNSAAGSTAMTEEEKYRLFYAAAQTKDTAIQMQVSKKIGLLDASGKPTPYYRTFLTGSIAWAQRDTAFAQQYNTPEKAKQYVQKYVSTP